MTIKAFVIPFKIYKTFYALKFDKTHGDLLFIHTHTPKYNFKVRTYLFLVTNVSGMLALSNSDSGP